MSWAIVFLIAAVLRLAAGKLGFLKKHGGGEGTGDHWPVFPKKLLSPVVDRDSAGLPRQIVA